AGTDLFDVRLTPKPKAGREPDTASSARCSAHIFWRYVRCPPSSPPEGMGCRELPARASARADRLIPPSAPEPPPHQRSPAAARRAACVAGVSRRAEARLREKRSGAQ